MSAPLDRDDLYLAHNKARSLGMGAVSPAGASGARYLMQAGTHHEQMFVSPYDYYIQPANKSLTSDANKQRMLMTDKT